MSKLQLLNDFFMQRLTVAAVEIFGAVQEVIVEYQDEISRSKEENERLQRILDLVLKPEIKLHRTDPGQIIIAVFEEVPHEQQEWSPSPGQEDIEIKQIKEQEFDTSNSTYPPSGVQSNPDGKNPTMSSQEDSERNDLSTTPAEQNKIELSPSLGQEDIEITQIKEEQEFDTSDSTYTPFNLERDSDGKRTNISSQEDSERNDLSTTPAEQNKIEPDEEGYAASEPIRDSQLLSAVNPDSSEAQSENAYRCDVCNKSYGVKGRLTLHMRLHTETPYHCTFCLKSFKEKGALKVHVMTHTGERPYRCNVCEKHFKGKGSLRMHIRVHTGERLYSCLVCGKHFTKNCHLNDHIRTHTGEKPYSCHSCPKKFGTNKQLTVHVRTHTGEKPYSCHVCGKHFRERGAIIGHMRTHTGEKPFKCNFCERHFSSRANMQKHMRTHTGEKPFKCNFCERHFKLSRTRTAHIKTKHKGEHLHTCRDCDKSYIKISSLRKHVETIHRGPDPGPHDMF